LQYISRVRVKWTHKLEINCKHNGKNSVPRFPFIDLWWNSHSPMLASSVQKSNEHIGRFFMKVQLSVRNFVVNIWANFSEGQKIIKGNFVGKFFEFKFLKIKFQIFYKQNFIIFRIRQIQPSKKFQIFLNRWGEFFSHKITLLLHNAKGHVFN
jgi:hypothetical protein